MSSPIELTPRQFIRACSVGPLKNAIDLASRPYGQSAWTGKPVGMISASVGLFGESLLAAGSTATANLTLTPSFPFHACFDLGAALQVV
jgi:NAD(P)H-dependent FMN reductase